MQKKLLENYDGARVLFDHLRSAGLYIIPPGTFPYEEEDLLPSASGQYEIEKATPKKLMECIRVFTESHLLEYLDVWRDDGMKEGSTPDDYERELRQICEEKEAEGWKFTDGSTSRLGVINRSNDVFSVYCNPSVLHKNIGNLIESDEDSKLLATLLEAYVENTKNETFIRFTGGDLCDGLTSIVDEDAWFSYEEEERINVICQSISDGILGNLKSPKKIKCFEITSSTIYPVLQYPRAFYVLTEINKDRKTLDIVSFYRAFESW